MISNQRWMVILWIFCGAVNLFAQNKVTGIVKDKETGEFLISANVIIKNTDTGTLTDTLGYFSLESDLPLPWNLEISYVGYQSQIIQISTYGHHIEIFLEPGLYLNEGVVISASRRKEGIQNAPASVSILSSPKIASSGGSINPLRSLINTPGVQVQQQSGGELNITMRGNAQLFGTSVYPILDYRPLISPGLGHFVSSYSPINAIDLDRIEVVRGPGSVLYGPRVTSGVIHFISKNPFDSPGTTIEMIGGEMNSYKVSVRHATHNEKRTLGYKINAHYSRGDEFSLDINDPQDALQIAKQKNQIVDYPIDPETGLPDFEATPQLIYSESDLDPDQDGNKLQDHYWGSTINATLEYRPNPGSNFALNLGRGQNSVVFYGPQGEGLGQETAYHTQLKGQVRNLFVQFNFSTHNGGSDDRPIFFYQSGLRGGIAETHYQGQAHYDLPWSSFLNSIWTMGFDFQKSKLETNHRNHGRFEDNDDYTLIGAYLQGKLNFHPSLYTVLGGRYDHFDFNEGNKFSPRLSLVYNPKRSHTFRVSFNQANAPVNTLTLYSDFPIVRTPVFNIWISGNINAQTFSQQPEIDWIILGIPNTPYELGFPLAAAYGAVTPFVLEQLEVEAANNPQLASFLPLLQNLLLNNTIDGFSNESFLGNIFNNQLMGILNAPGNVISTEQTFELGYKGVIKDKLAINVDIYHLTRKNFPYFTAISPFVIATNIPSDLGNTVSTTFEPQILMILLDKGLEYEMAENIAREIASQLGMGYTQAGQAFVKGLEDAGLPFHGVIQTLQMPESSVPNLASGYRIMDQIGYWGADLSLEYYFTNQVTVFGNYSWLEESAFMPEVVGTGSNIPYSLSLPRNKFRLGVNYYPVSGIYGQLAFQHDDSFHSDLGQYSGTVESINVVDASIGYQFGNSLQGLNVELSATNLFNREYRVYPNLPRIGRRAVARIIYNFGNQSVK